MTVLASVTSPARDHARRRRRAAMPLDGHRAAPRRPGGRAATSCRSRARNTWRALVAEARASCGTRPAAPSRRPRSPTSSPARAAAHASGSSPSTSRLPAGISSSSASSGGPVLAHQRRTRAVVVDGDDRHRARVVDDLALERRRRRAPRRCPTRDGDDVALGGRPARRAWRKPVAATGSAGRCGPSRASRSSRWGLRPSARARAAPTNSRNSGAGPVGPALELGVGLGADPERVAAQLDELDEPAVGRRARAARGRRPRSGCGSGG